MMARLLVLTGGVALFLLGVRRLRSTKRRRWAAVRQPLALLEDRSSSDVASVVETRFKPCRRPTCVTRRVVVADAVEVLETIAHRGALLDGHVITSLPDITECAGEASLQAVAYERFLRSTVTLLVNLLPPNGVAIFYQSDGRVRTPSHARKGSEVTLLLKIHIVLDAARSAGAHCLFHKIVLFGESRRLKQNGQGRPPFSQMVAVSRDVPVDLCESSAGPHVLHRGRQTWTRGMCEGSCAVACRFLVAVADELERRQWPGPGRKVIAPFCGEGMALAVANEHGFDSEGYDLSPRRCRKAARLRLLHN